MKKILELLFTFMKIGLFTFGGGYAMISIIEGECVDKKKWISDDELMKMTVIAESTPGPVAINCATFVGYRYAGITGAIAATVGVVVPSFCVIYLIAMFFDDFLEIELIAKAFKGIKIAVGILICSVGINMFKKMQKRRLALLIVVTSFLLILLTNFLKWEISSLNLILLAAVVGGCACLRKKSTMTKEETE